MSENNKNTLIPNKGTTNDSASAFFGDEGGNKRRYQSSQRIAISAVDSRQIKINNVIKIQCTSNMNQFKKKIAKYKRKVKKYKDRIKGYTRKINSYSKRMKCSKKSLKGLSY